MIDLTGPVAIVAHDAGAANILFAWLEQSGSRDWRPVMAGPAAVLWRAQFPDVPLVDHDAALAGAAMLLSGTGWASDIEHDARRRARIAGLRSIAVIDHWVNYRARFQRAGEETLPDEIWVADAYAAAEARRAIPEIPVREYPNRYLADQALAAGPRPDDGDVLFVAEPARSDWGRGVPGEFQALDYLVEHGGSAGIDSAARLRIRPHPSDPAGKYDAWIAAHPNAHLDASPDMGTALAAASWVVGLQSFALVIAMAAGRGVICALPPGAPACPLPHLGIVHLRDLVATTR